METDRQQVEAARLRNVNEQNKATIADLKSKLEASETANYTLRKEKEKLEYEFTNMVPYAQEGNRTKKVATKTQDFQR